MIVHLADMKRDPMRGLCGVALEGVDHERGEENCPWCILMWALWLFREKYEAAL